MQRSNDMAELDQFVFSEVREQLKCDLHIRGWDLPIRGNSRGRRAGAPGALVERFDVEPFSDFSAK